MKLFKHFYDVTAILYHYCNIKNIEIFVNF